MRKEAKVDAAHNAMGPQRRKCVSPAQKRLIYPTMLSTKAKRGGQHFTRCLSPAHRG